MALVDLTWASAVVWNVVVPVPPVDATTTYAVRVRAFDPVALVTLRRTEYVPGAV